MKTLFILLLLSSFLGSIAGAQEENSEVYEGFADEVQPTQKKPLSHLSVGISSIQWNDTLKLQQGINRYNDSANYSGMTLSVQKEMNYALWGWSASAFLGSGSAVGGGNSTSLPYQKNKIGFVVYGASPRIFYRLSGRINTGVSIMAFMRNVDWPREAGDPTIDSGRTVNISSLADLNVRLFSKWDFYTGLGPLAEGATFWKIGLNYRF